MRDVTPRRSIRSVPVSSGGHRRTPPRFRGDIPLPKRRRGGFLWWIIGIVVVCITAGLLLSTLFEGATVTLTPKTAAITPPANLTALPSAPAGSLGYQIVTVSQSATTSVQANGTQHVSKAATGTVVLYNTYNTSTRKFIAGTKLVAPDGTSYHVNSAITVPAAKKNADGTLKAGTVIATITADAAGASYNRSSQTTFTFPSLKGTAPYTKFYAQSQGPIDGGFVGDKPTIAATDMQIAQAALKTELDTDLKRAADAAVPPDYLPVQGSLAAAYDDALATQTSSSTAALSQTVHATLAIVKSADLASMLAKLLVQGYSGESVGFKSPNPLVLQVASSTGQSITGPLTMLLQGNPTLVWQFDQEALKQSLLGKNKALFQSIIETYSPAIDSARASIRPFWKARFPSDPAKLTVITSQ
jgi:hypothetical protein